MLKMSRSGLRKHRGKLRLGVGGTHVDNAHRLDACPRRLGAERGRGLAILHTAPEFPLRSDNQMLVEGVGLGLDLNPFAASGDHRKHRTSGSNDPHVAWRGRARSSSIAHQRIFPVDGLPETRSGATSRRFSLHGRICSSAFPAIPRTLSCHRPQGGALSTPSGTMIFSWRMSPTDPAFRGNHPGTRKRTPNRTIYIFKPVDSFFPNE